MSSLTPSWGEQWTTTTILVTGSSLLSLCDSCLFVNEIYFWSLPFVESSKTFSQQLYLCWGTLNLLLVTFLLFLLLEVMWHQLSFLFFSFFCMVLLCNSWILPREPSFSVMLCASWYMREWLPLNHENFSNMAI